MNGYTIPDFGALSKETQNLVNRIVEDIRFVMETSPENIQRQKKYWITINRPATPEIFNKLPYFVEVSTGKSVRFLSDTEMEIDLLE